MDDDRTVLPPPRATQQGPGQEHDLPPGTRFGELEILDTVAAGGFGIVYRTQDHSLNRIVALKEYMPASLASRDAGTRNVRVRSANGVESFDIGLRSFVKEARFLAHFDHPAVVKVHMFFRANGTAYMVMPFYEGITLKAKLAAMAAPPEEAWLKAFLSPVMDALSMMHAEQCFHRDISPDNILVLKGTGAPMLLDFGAARHVIKDSPQALTVILKPNYAPIEQYDDFPGMTQGDWTDVYALAATLYAAISSRPPPPAHSRLINDTCIPAVKAGAGRYSEAFLRAIDNALTVKPDLRTASIQAFRQALGIEAAAGKPAAVPVQETGAAPTAAAAAAAAAAPETPAAAAAASAARATPAAATPAAAAASAPGTARRKWLAIGIGGVLAAGAAGLLVERSIRSNNGSTAADLPVLTTPSAGFARGPGGSAAADRSAGAQEAASVAALAAPSVAAEPASPPPRPAVTVPTSRSPAEAETGAVSPPTAAVSKGEAADGRNSGTPPVGAPAAAPATDALRSTSVETLRAASSETTPEPAPRTAEAAEPAKKRTQTVAAGKTPAERHSPARTSEAGQSNERCAELASRYQNGSISYSEYAKSCAR